MPENFGKFALLFLVAGVLVSLSEGSWCPLAIVLLWVIGMLQLFDRLSGW